MNKIQLTILFFLFIAASSSARSKLYGQLDNELAQRELYLTQKLNKIDSLRTEMLSASKLEAKLDANMKILETYRLLCADSAIYYANKASELATTLNDESRIAEISIHKAFLFATSGYYKEGEQLLQNINSAQLTDAQRCLYYKTYSWLYNVWMDYDTVIRSETDQRNLLIEYADSALAYMPKESGEWLYWQGEINAFRGNYANAESYYQQCLNIASPHDRTYASAACALALIYQNQQHYDQCEEWFIRSAISDQHCAVKENFALQAFSEFLVNIRNDEERANRYISYALADAIYYNNRLRLVEIARRFPSVVYPFIKSEQSARNFMTGTTLFVALLALGLVIAIVMLMSGLRRLRRSNRTIHEMYHDMGKLNKQIKETIQNRETYASLFIELSAAYIDKYNNLQKTIERKVKVKQFDDIVSTLQTTRMKEADIKEFFLNFDRSFLTLYPNFITEFNQLMQKEYQIQPKKGEFLTNELRMMALIRLGVKDTAKLATLLFYSPQTIYNYRSVLKSHALSPDDFEQQILHLCES